MTREIDPRSKFILVVCISTLAIVMGDIYHLSIILILTVLIAGILKANLIGNLKKIKNLLYIFLGIIVLQSIFTSRGHVIFSIGRLGILTTAGLTMGLQFFLRIMIIIFSATIITTSSSREIIQGFVQWKLPYDIAFMVAIGIRFLPILREEIRESLLAIQLRGVEIRQIPIRQRINLYSYLFTPILVSTILKAEKLSIAVEMRGFRAYDSRTSYLNLKMSRLDYIIIATSVIATACYILGVYIF